MLFWFCDAESAFALASLGLPTFNLRITPRCRQGGPTPTARLTKLANEASVLLRPDFCALYGKGEPGRANRADKVEKAAVEG